MNHILAQAVIDVRRDIWKGVKQFMRADLKPNFAAITRVTGLQNQD